MSARSRGRGSAWPWTSGTMTAARPSARRANSSASAPSRRCRSASGTIRRARNTSAAYFERFDNIWCHGDFAEWTEHGGMIIHGRSDATLNPGGVRIGTAEIYNQVEKLPEIAEAICIGQDWDNDVRVVLFVRLAPGVDARRRSGAEDQGQDPRRRQPAPCAGQDHRRRRHSAHQVRQDHRACGARRRPRPDRQEQGGARQSRRRWSFSATSRRCGH